MQPAVCGRYYFAVDITLRQILLCGRYYFAVEITMN